MKPTREHRLPTTTGETQYKLFGGRMRLLLLCSLVLTLTVSPLIAENRPVLKLDNFYAGEHVDNSLVGASILRSLPARPATSLAALPSDKDNNAPGINKSIIIGLLILAGATTAVILLWPNGHDKPGPAPLPPAVTPTSTGTVLAAGTPAVSSPNQ